MEIKPYDKTISEVLTEKRYKIPGFQRDFSWEKKYCREFLYDMFSQIRVGDELTSTDYFLGTMLFLKEEGSVELKVIDGQQRLTTITILFSAIARLLRQKNEVGLSDATFKNIVFIDRRNIERKVVHPPNSFPYFTKVIQKIDPDKKAKPSSDEEDLIKDTYDYFEKALSEAEISKTIKKAFVNKGEEEIIDTNKYDYIEILIALRDQVLDSKLIYIESTSHEQANMIFEILNAKGKKLSPIDLIKNKVFENVGKTIDEEAEVQWKKLQRKLQNNDVPMLVFFRHFWASKYKKCTANSLYGSVNGQISKGNKDDKQKKTVALLAELERNAEIYCYICSPDDITFWDKKKAYQEVIDSLVFTRDFNVTQYRIAVLALIKARRENKISMKWFIRSLKCIEEFTFIFFKLFSSRASKVESLFSKFAIELTNASKENASTVIENTLMKGLKNEIQGFSEFRERFKLLFYTKSLDVESTDFVLVRYVINKMNVYNSTTSNFVDKACSLEHIAPDDKDNEVSWNIGNIIALEEVINNRLGNIEYDLKKVGYKDSNYKEVQTFVEENSTWEIEQIDDRADQLADLFYNVIMDEAIRKKN